MSARVNSAHIYHAWCEQCAEGGAGDQAEANQWAADHNAEHHSKEDS